MSKMYPPWTEDRGPDGSETFLGIEFHNGTIGYFHLPSDPTEAFRVAIAWAREMGATDEDCELISPTLLAPRSIKLSPAEEIDWINRLLAPPDPDSIN